MPIRLISMGIAFVILMTIMMAITVGLVKYGDLVGVDISEGLACGLGLIGGIFISAWATNSVFDTINKRLPPKWKFSFETNRPEWSLWECGWRLWIQYIVILIIVGGILYWLCDWLNIFSQGN